MADRVVQTDAKAVDLVRSMSTTLVSVPNYKTISEKVSMLKDPIIRLFKQIVECSTFIHEYIQHGFGGRQLFSTDMGRDSRISSTNV